MKTNVNITVSTVLVSWKIPYRNIATLQQVALDTFLLVKLIF
jgi:hypothetical protein